MKRTLILIVVLILSISESICQIPTSSLVSKWEFAGNANDPIGNNNGTVNGATLTADRFGNCGSAYSFDGINDYIITPSGGPTGSVSRSLCFWANTSNTNLQTAFGYGTANLSGGLYQVLFNHSCQGVGFDFSQTALMRGGNTFLNNAWHHFAVVINASIGTDIADILFYVDGVQITNTVCVAGTGNGPINTVASLPIQIGKDPNASARWFSGKLDDFYFYNRAISASEVLTIYNDQSTNVGVGPISGNTLVCTGSINAYSVTAAGPVTWNVSSGWSGSSTSSVINVTAGSGTAQISASSGGCTLSPLTVSAMPLPVISASTSNSLLCQGETAVLTASGGVSYTWQPVSSNSQSLMVFPSSNTVFTVSATGPNGCINTATVLQTVSSCNGVNESSLQKSEIVVCPNPAESYFYVNVPKGSSSEFFLYDIFGRVAKKIEMAQATQKVSTEELANGVYILKNKENLFISKIVVEKK